jgi:alpha-ketoglutarate-dependent taurine dioxygenase
MVIASSFAAAFTPHSSGSFAITLSARQQALPPIESLKPLLRKHKVVILRGASVLGQDSFVQWAQGSETIESAFVKWDFGHVMELRVDPAAKNYLFSREAVPLHWDGAFHDEPSTLVFHCVERNRAAAAGGETVFVDTESIWNQASLTDRKVWELLSFRYQTEKLAHYGGSIDVRLVRQHPEKPRQPILRFAEPVHTRLNPVQITPSPGSPAIAMNALADLIERTKVAHFRYQHDWEVGDIVLADNHALLHGRNPLSEDDTRTIRRLQLR